MITEQNRLAFGPMMLDWQERINMERMRRERPARARAKMKEHGFAAMILGEAENRVYATANDPGGVVSFVPGAAGFSLLFAEHPDDTIDYCHTGGIVKQDRNHVSWIKPENIRVCRTMRSTQAAAGAEENAKANAKNIHQDLRALGVDKERIAFDGVQPIFRAALEAEGLKLVRAPEVMTEARAIKTIDEVNCLKMAGYIANQGFWEIYANLRPGISECEVASHVAASYMRMQNRGNYLVSLRSGPNTAPNYLSHSPSDRIIQPGDLVFCDMIGPLFCGYRVCYYRVFKCGTKVTAKEKDWYKKCYEWLYAAMEAVKPGATTSEVAEKFPPASTWGYKEEYETTDNACGHGLGLGQHENPAIGRAYISYPQVIEKGMTIALETWYGEEGVGGCRIENLVLVNDKGCENLYTWPDEEIVVPEHSLLIR